MLNEIFTIVISFFSITVFFSDLPDHARNLVQLPKYFYSSLILVVAQIVLFKEFCMLLWVIIMYFLNIDYAVEYFSHYIGIYTSIQLLFWASILIRYTYREAWHDMDISKQIMAQQAYLLAAFKLPTMMIAFSFFFRVVDNQVFFLMLMTMDMITLPIAVRFFEVYTCFKIMDAVSQKNAIADCNKS
ncbi:hypothetical protein CRE_15971 [Caenorhabditis remanei]|uniref:Uncharacterized protein n=1 Tax=Caenorhabditis remanei TaxID=31234 RepID=E3MBU4_CAERE|nr:hypothetical protein CRE_15971 [Caenorhabditis remanei]